jgi:hypothetical protein
MACLYECKQRSAWQLGLKWLFDLLNDKTRYKKIRELYSFSYMDFIRLTAEFDVYFVEWDKQVAERDRQIAERDRQIAEREQSIAALTSRLHETDERLVASDVILNKIRNHWGMRVVNFFSKTKLFYH